MQVRSLCQVYWKCFKYMFYPGYSIFRLFMLMANSSCPYFLWSQYIFLIHDTHHIRTKMNWPSSSHNTRWSCWSLHCMYLYLDELRNCFTPAGGNWIVRMVVFIKRWGAYCNNFGPESNHHCLALSSTHWVTDAEIQLMRLWHISKLLMLLPMVEL